MHFHTIVLLGCLAAASLAAPIPSNAKSIKDTCTNIKLAEDRRILTASCQSDDGSIKESSINLNDFIGNINGQFKWAQTDFANDAEIRRELKNVTVYEGYLKDSEGNGQHATIDLADEIKNVDGTLTYVGGTPPPRPATPSVNPDEGEEGGGCEEGC